MNEVNARRARLQQGWVTVFGWVYHLGSLNRVPASAGVKAGMSPLKMAVNETVCSTFEVEYGKSTSMCDPIWHVSSRSGEAGVPRT